MVTMPPEFPRPQPGVKRLRSGRCGTETRAGFIAGAMAIMGRKSRAKGRWPSVLFRVNDS